MGCHGLLEAYTRSVTTAHGAATVSQVRLPSSPIPSRTVPSEPLHDWKVRSLVNEESGSLGFQAF